MSVGWDVVPPWFFQTAAIVHDLTFIATVCMFIIHIYLAVAHPLMRQGLVSMRFGVISESYAREHHAKWYFGEKRAKELWKRISRRSQKAERPLGSGGSLDRIPDYRLAHLVGYG
jgi:cytochrome b subunit of formate dehydrogenase